MSILCFRWREEIPLDQGRNSAGGGQGGRDQGKMIVLAGINYVCDRLRRCCCEEQSLAVGRNSRQYSDELAIITTEEDHI